MAPLVWFSYLFGVFRQQALAKERWSICDAISIRAMYMAVLLNVLTHGESDMNLKNKLKLAAIALSHTTNLGKNFDFSKAAPALLNFRIHSFIPKRSCRNIKLVKRL
jgi:hypothetical protein